MMPTEQQNTNKLSTGLMILGFILLLVVILLLTGYYKKAISFINPDLEACKGGTCKSSCAAGVEIQNNNVQCSDSAKVCCLPNNRTASPECAGRKKGDICGNVMLCDQDLVCVSRCEYCALNPEDEKCTPTGTIGKAITALDSSFSCGCTDAQCIEFDNSKLGTCVKSFCPSENVLAKNYMCCSSPYK